MNRECFISVALVLLVSSLAVAGTPSTVHDFAQVGDGGGVKTIFLIMNRSEEAASITISFFTGDPGTPWQLNINGTTGAVYEAGIPEGGMLKLTTAGAGAVPQAGWARLVSDQNVGAQLLFEIRVENELVTQAAVESTPPLVSTDLFVEEQPGSATGIAIASLSPEGPLRVVLSLTAENGEAAGETELTLASRGHRALFMNQLFEALGNFRGTMKVRASGPFTIVTLQQTGLVLGSLPPVWSY